ncbi:MAG: DUF1847 domain-containing protein [Cyclobacteriaceae bacterium]
MLKDYSVLYDNNDRTIMKLAEDSLNPKLDRIHEIIAFAREAEITTIGIANCITFEKEAKQLENLLQKHNLSVVRANCKLGCMPNDAILPGYKGVSCNPAGQAKALEEGGTEMNVVMGLCLGHDMVFNKNSKVPTSTLIVKDRKLKHHPLDGFE